MDQKVDFYILFYSEEIRMLLASQLIFVQISV